MDDVPGFLNLLADARAGDRQATEKLLALMRPWLEQLARRHAPPRRADGSTADLVQEAWLRAWQKLDQFQGSDNEVQALAMFRAWLERIVCRLGLNATRDQKAQQRNPGSPFLQLDGARASGSSGPVLDPSDGRPTPSANVQAEEEARRVHEALARLPDPLDRDIVRLRFFQGLSLRQIATQLGRDHETVRQRYHAAMHRLQGDLET
jgi:RNA polymerase sigma-70 factor (ECF subfamily)